MRASIRSWRMNVKGMLPVTVLLCCVLFASPAFAGPFTWVEHGSAGNLPGTANITLGGFSLQEIIGNLMSPTEVDMYQIRITDFLNFSATTLEGVDLVNDPQLFLFNSAGL